MNGANRQQTSQESENPCMESRPATQLIHRFIRSGDACVKREYLVTAITASCANLTQAVQHRYIVRNICGIEYDTL